ncbi:hypothetical protein [Ideonella sp. A 288]|uniref:hypothetical protein n=1 Tax=Ideonella sp. A 288 TaxID=1962181 RepID=UPI0011856FA6|nr:hypothetical protein [Ideonella sp. A 288]
MTMTISPYDLTLGLKNAIEVWSQYKTQQREKSWFVVGTCKFFEEIGATVPDKPISEADLIALSAVVERCERIRADPMNATTRGTRQFNAAVAQIAPFFKSELGITLDASVSPSNAINNEVADLATATTAAKAEYMQLRAVPYAVPGAGYTRPPAPGDAYLREDRDLTAGATSNIDDIAGTKVDAGSEYWVPPDPTTTVEGTYGKVPDALFK